MQTTRRQFLKSGLGCTVALTLGPTMSPAADKPGRISIGFQLYTVRGAFAKDVPGTLKTLSQIGYQAVEFWGYAGTPDVYEKYSARSLRTLLDDLGLQCCGMHLDLKALAKESLERTFDNNQTLGSRFLNLAAAQEKMASEAGISELATLLNDAAAQARPRNLTVGYHAHPFDFAKLGGRFAWEILFDRLKPELNMQMDVGNCLAGDGDPVAMLKRFPGRTRTIHIKEQGAITFDSDYYKEVFGLCETSGATKWYIVEMGDAEGRGFDVPREALAKLHRAGK